MRAIYWGMLFFAAGCADPASCDIDNGGCDVNAVCTPKGISAPTCACPSGWSGTGAPGSPCKPVLSALAVDGVDALSVTDVQVPVGTTSVTVTADTSSEGTVLLINGQDVRTLSVDVLKPLTLVTVQLGNPALTSVTLIVRERPSFTGGPIAGVLGSFSAIAMNDQADQLAVGPVGLFGCSDAGLTSFFADGGAWDVATFAGSANGCTGSQLSLSAAGDVLASVARQGVALRIFRRSGAAWSEDSVPALTATSGAEVALQGDGSTAWLDVANGDAGTLVHLVSAGTGWSVASMTTTTAVSVATSFDGDIVALGSPSLNQVEVRFADAGAETLTSDQGFGSHVALSGDGEVLAVTVQNPTEPAVQVFERQDDGGYARQLSLVAAIAPRSGGLTGALTATGVLSRDGNTVAAGFPVDGSVVIATRTQGVWAISEAELGSLLGFGSGVALSADGKRLAITSAFAGTVSVLDRR